MDLVDIAMLDIKVSNYTQCSVAAAALWVCVRASSTSSQIQKKVQREVGRVTERNPEFQSCVQWIESDVATCSRSTIRREGARGPRTKYNQYALQSFNEEALQFWEELYDDGDEEDDEDDEEDEEEEEEEEEVENEITTPLSMPLPDNRQRGTSFTLLGDGFALQDTDTTGLRRARSASLSHVSPVLSVNSSEQTKKYTIEQEKKLLKQQHSLDQENKTLKRSFDTSFDDHYESSTERKTKIRRVDNIKEDKNGKKKSDDFSFLTNERMC